MNQKKNVRSETSLSGIFKKSRKRDRELRSKGELYGIVKTATAKIPTSRTANVVLDLS